MFTVQFTEAKTVKGEFKNLYKSKDFASSYDATRFVVALMKRASVSDIRTVEVDTATA